jgi:hypothetical protein
MGVAMSFAGSAVFTLCAALACATSSFAGSVYKWTDQRGVVNYSSAPPPDAQRLKVVDTSPAVGLAGGASSEDVRYWREQRARELARDMREVETLRQRREAEQARQDQFRHQLALASQASGGDEERRRLAREQCLRERRVDCDQTGGYGYNPYYPSTIIARPARQTIYQAAPFPVSGSTLGPAPGTIAGTQAQLAPFRAAAPVAQRSASIRISR